MVRFLTRVTVKSNCGTVEIWGNPNIFHHLFQKLESELTCARSSFLFRFTFDTIFNYCIWLHHSKYVSIKCFECVCFMYWSTFQCSSSWLKLHDVVHINNEPYKIAMKLFKRFDNYCCGFLCYQRVTGVLYNYGPVSLLSLHLSFKSKLNSTFKCIKEPIQPNQIVQAMFSELIALNLQNMHTNSIVWLDNEREGGKVKSKATKICSWAYWLWAIIDLNLY